jgi:uncharacterized protein (TIGR02246 family)
MKKQALAGVAVFCAASLLAAQPAQVKQRTEASAEAAIRETAQAFAAAANAKDAAKIGSLYAEDAVLMPPNEPAVRGRSSIQAYWQKLIDAGARDVSLTTLAVATSGSVGYESGNYQFTMAAPNAQPATDRGKYLVGLRRDADGKWRLVYDSFNSDLPCPPAAPAAHH